MPEALVTPQADEPRLRIEDLRFSHGSLEILKGLNLAFYGGRHYTIVGPNGAGKSTLLDLLARLKKPQSGAITIMGSPLPSLNPRQLAKTLALAPQSTQFNFSFTVREVVKLGRRPYLGRWGRLSPQDEQVVESAIESLHLTRLADKPVTALSGGEAQRVVLARTLAQSASVILLDEPTNSLDIAQSIDLMTTLRQEVKKGGLVITVTHDLNLAAGFGDDMIFLKDGHLLASGPKEATMTSELLKKVFEADALVRPDDFTGGLALSFRKTQSE
jgi:iron complex transport system ATP-binding protein